MLLVRLLLPPRQPRSSQLLVLLLSLLLRAAGLAMVLSVLLLQPLIDSSPISSAC